MSAKPVYVGVHDDAAQATVEGLQQGYVICPAERRFQLLYTFLKKNQKKKCMVRINLARLTFFFLVFFCFICCFILVVFIHISTYCMYYVCPSSIITCICLLCMPANAECSGGGLTIDSPRSS